MPQLRDQRSTTRPPPPQSIPVTYRMAGVGVSLMTGDTGSIASTCNLQLDLPLPPLGAMTLTPEPVVHRFGDTLDRDY